MSLQGKRIVVTAGPTREYFDPVRFITNRSTGTMGYELANHAAHMGASVHLISGPVTYSKPEGVAVVTQITTCQELLEATLDATVNADILIMAAAPCDERPETFSQEKIKKTGSGSTIKMVSNPDILSTITPLRPHLFKLGFAAETEDHVANAVAKAKRKGLNLIFVNDVSGSSGFGTGDNGGTLLDCEGLFVETYPTVSKSLLAFKLILELDLQYGRWKNQ